MEDKDTSTSPFHTYFQNGEPSGIVILDKSKDVTTRSLDNAILGHLANLLGVTKRCAPKVGHAGTLDPFATGLVIVGVGGATKQLHKLEHSKKTYAATIRLGWGTDTDDLTGERIDISPASEREMRKIKNLKAVKSLSALDDADIKEALDKFVGRISQVPCTFSAKRVNKTRAYDLARSGKVPELVPQEVEIFSLNVGEISHHKIHCETYIDVQITLTVSAGTFIRAIARDLGVALGVGAHLIELRRLSVSNDYHVEEAIPVDKVLETENIDDFAKFLIRFPLGTALTIGTFDGVHIGHQELLKATDGIAKQHGVQSLAIVIDRPLKSQLTSLEKRVAYMKQLVDEVIVIKFDEVRNLTFQDFLTTLHTCYNLKHLTMTNDMKFGANSDGNAITVADYITKNMPDVTLTCVPLVKNPSAEAKVSSSYIRNLLQTGDVKQAAILLGKSYKLSGEVVHGFERGRSLGFPTANMKIHDQCSADNCIIPADGVYYGTVTWAKERHPAMISVGTNPTFENLQRTVEVHIPGRSDYDLYDKTITVGFEELMRPMQKFASVDELVAQLAKDASRTLEVWNSLQ